MVLFQKKDEDEELREREKGEMVKMKMVKEGLKSSRPDEWMSRPPIAPPQRAAGGSREERSECM